MDRAPEKEKKSQNGRIQRGKGKTAVIGFGKRGMLILKIKKKKIFLKI